MSTRLPEPKRERLEAWMATQPVEPNATAVMLKALDQFLDRDGAPPERDGEKAKK